MDQLRRSNESENSLQKGWEETVQQLADRDRFLAEMGKELEESKELCSWYEKEPYKAAGLKKCNRCKRFTWQHSQKACMNYQCTLNLKTFCVASTQTDSSVIQFDDIRFEELEEQDAVAAAAKAHDERMMQWREQNEPLLAQQPKAAPTPHPQPVAPEKDEDDNAKEPEQKKPRTLTPWGDSSCNYPHHLGNIGMCVNMKL